MPPGAAGESSAPPRLGRFGDSSGRVPSVSRFASFVGVAVLPGLLLFVEFGFVCPAFCYLFGCPGDQQHMLWLSANFAIALFEEEVSVG